MPRIVITGISGLVGGWLWDAIGHRHEVFGIAGKSGLLPDFPERQHQAPLEEADEYAAAVAAFQPDIIVHLAAASGIGYCERNQEHAWQVNVAATRALVDVAVNLKARFLFASSGQVFSGEQGLYEETDPTGPVNFYGNTKLEAEKIVLDTISNSLIFRLCNSFGPGKYRGSSFSEWIRAKCKSEEEIPLFHDQYRSPIDQVTLTEVLSHLIESDHTGIIHLSGEQRVSRLEFGKLLLEHFGCSTDRVRSSSQNEVEIGRIQAVDTSLSTTRLRQITPVKLPMLREAIRNVYPA